MDGTAMTMSNFYEYLYGRTMRGIASDGAPHGARRHPDGSPCSAKSDETCPILRARRLLDEADRLDPNLVEKDRQGTEGNEAAESPEERARREYADVVARYTNADGTKKRGWLLAPNGKPTNLTERQWVQVRTPSFKKRFGDWEKNAVAKAILADREIVCHDSILTLPAEEQRIVAKEIYAKLKSGSTVMTEDGRNVHFRTRGFKEIKSHSADPHTLAIVPILKEVIASAHYIGEGDVEDKPANKDVKAYHLYARRVNLGDGSMIARIVIREDKNGEHFYDEESTSLETIKEIYGQGSREPNTGSDRKPPCAAHSLAQFFAECKGLSASKVVDENGEPNVVFGR